MAYQFKQIPLIALIANPSVTPAQPAVMILSGLAVILSLVFFPLGQLAAWIAWPLTAYTNSRRGIIRPRASWNNSAGEFFSLFRYPVFCSASLFDFCRLPYQGIFRVALQKIRQLICRHDLNCIIDLRDLILAPRCKYIGWKVAYHVPRCRLGRRGLDSNSQRKTHSY